jgi:hypothetical protein
VFASFSLECFCKCLPFFVLVNIGSIMLHFLSVKSVSYVKELTTTQYTRQ